MNVHRLKPQSWPKVPAEKAHGDETDVKPISDSIWRNLTPVSALKPCREWRLTRFHQQEEKMNRKSITCSNGHHLRAAGALAGKTLPCPRCGVAVTIPWEEAFTVPEEPPVRDTLSDTGVMRILGEPAVAPAAETKTDAPQANPESHRPCPRCEYLVSDQSTVCPKCACYMGMMPQFLRALLPKNLSA